MKADLFEAPDYYNLDDLLSEEHKLVRSAARDWVKRDISPIINDYAQKAEFPTQIIGGLADIGAFGPYIPTLERFSAKTRDKLLEASLILFNERGFAAVTTASIAQHAGVLEGTLWYHFRTKKDILTAHIELLQQVFEGRRKHFIRFGKTSFKA